ncbi:MAG: hypothetical protein MUF30_01860 [Burkholderiales bacterium]|nr:hypothetical protein [Burkholderiales bacterium]
MIDRGQRRATRRAVGAVCAALWTMGLPMAGAQTDARDLAAPDEPGRWRERSLTDEPTVPRNVRADGIQAFTPYGIDAVREIDTSQMVGTFLYDGLPVLRLARDGRENTAGLDVVAGLPALARGYVLPGGAVDHRTKPAVAATAATAFLTSGGLGYLAVDAGRSGERLGLRVNASSQAGSRAWRGVERETRAFGSLALDWSPLPGVELSWSSDREWYRQRGVRALLNADIDVALQPPPASDFTGARFVGGTWRDALDRLRARWTGEAWTVEAAWLTADNRFDDYEAVGAAQGAGAFALDFVRDPLSRRRSDTFQLGATWQGLLAQRPIEVGLRATRMRHTRNFGDYATEATGPVRYGDRAVLTPVARSGPVVRTGSQAVADEWSATAQWRALASLTVTGNLRQLDYRQTGADTDVVRIATPLRGGGLVWHPGGGPDATPAFYVQAGEALELGSVAFPGTGNVGRTLASAIATQREVGMRLGVSEALRATVALFEVERGLEYLDRQAVFRRDGRLRQRGLEVTVIGTPAPKWTVYALALGSDAQAVETTGGALDGRRPSLVPRWRSVLQVERDDAFAAGWHVALTVTGIGPRQVALESDARIASYALIDLNVRRELGERLGTLRLSLENLTDRAHWEWASGGFYFQGLPRRATAWWEATW